MAAAGALEIIMFSNIARLTKDMADAKRTVTSAVATIEKTLGALGVGFSAHLLISKFESVVGSMDKLQNTSEKTGVSVENLSKLEFFSGVSGSNVDAVSSSMSKLATNMVSVENEGAAASQAMKFLGISAKDSDGNLKDLSVLYREIAERLFIYSDGAGKNAIARALMGKAGAEQLPTMKKLIELGDIEAATTTAQAVAAEEYGIKVAKLSREKEILWNIVVSALLPTMGTLVETLIKASRESDSLGSSVKKLSSDKSIESWADMFARGLGFIVDAAAGARDMIAGVGDALAGIMKLYLTWGDYARGALTLDIAQMRTAVREAGSVMDAFEERQRSRLARPQMRDSIDAAIEARKKRQALEDIFGAGGKGAGGAPLNFALSDPKKAAAELKLYENALQSLEQQLGKLNDQTQYEKTLYQLASGSLQKLTVDHGAHLLQLAREIDVKTNLLAVSKLLNEQNIAAEKETERVNDIATQYRRTLQLENEEMVFQASLFGLTKDAQELLIAAHKIDLDLRQKILALGDEETEQTRAAIKNMTERAESQKKVSADMIADRQKLDRDWTTGANAAFDDYIDHATNAAEIARNLFTNAFRSMEDALVEWRKTGEFNSRKLADAIIDDLIRIQIRAEITGPIAQYAKDNGGFMGMIGKFLGFGGGAAAGAGGGFTADFSGAVAGFATGTDFVPRDGLAFLHKGEAVTPAGASNGDTFNVDMRGASLEAVQELRAFVIQRDATFNERVIGTVTDARRRGRDF